MIDHRANRKFVAPALIFDCPITQQQVSVSSYKEFLTRDERTIWWYCQACTNWHIVNPDSTAEENPLNLDALYDNSG